VLQAIGHHILDGAENIVPTDKERLGSLFPTQLASPMGQKQSKGIGDAKFTRGPGNLFDVNAAISAINTSKGANQKNRKRPEWDELPGTFRKMIVGGTSLVTFGTESPGILPRSNPDFDDIAAELIPADIGIAETLDWKDPIQYGLYL
jgi:hypothetical protein